MEQRMDQRNDTEPGMVYAADCRVRRTGESKILTIGRATTTATAAVGDSPFSETARFTAEPLYERAGCAMPLNGGGGRVKCAPAVSMRHNGHLGGVRDAYPDAYQETEECDQCGGMAPFHHEGCIYRCPVEDLHEG